MNIINFTLFNDSKENYITVEAAGESDELAAASPQSRLALNRGL
jgi:hypothetical protein